MFSKKHSDEPKHRRRKNPALGVLRTFLSLIMISILGLGVYSAYRSFSGVDPLKIDPLTLVSSLAKENHIPIPSGVLGISTQFNFLSRFSKSPNPPNSSSASNPPQEESEGIGGLDRSSPAPHARLEFKFAIASDSHNDNTDLAKAIAQAKDLGAKFVIGSGDYTDVGTVDELTGAKQVFDNGKLTYYTIPGDHDLWDSRNRSLPALSDFHQVFGRSYQSFSYDNSRILLVDNSDNYLGVDQAESDWLDHELSSARVGPNTKLLIVIASTPFFHPSSDHYMGKVDASVKVQADNWVAKFASANVNLILAGDTHFYSHYSDPRNNIDMVAVGAVTADRNLQKPRFTMVDVYEDGSYNIEDLEIK